MLPCKRGVCYALARSLGRRGGPRKSATGADDGVPPSWLRYHNYILCPFVNRDFKKRLKNTTFIQLSYS